MRWNGNRGGDNADEGRDTARDPEPRLERMQVNNADVLRIVATEPEVGDRRQELCRRFRHLHIRGGWFWGEPELWEYIDGLEEYVGSHGYRLRLSLRRSPTTSLSTSP